MSIAALLRAAEYLERKDREAEHGYASTLPMPDDLRSVTKRPKTKKSQGSRTTHNELEKNRIIVKPCVNCVSSPNILGRPEGIRSCMVELVGRVWDVKQEEVKELSTCQDLPRVLTAVCVTISTALKGK
ncbi:unnamed protein product, partial [Timema podura]|nr:unnamed protein product [Timema podura]